MPTETPSAAIVNELRARIASGALPLGARVPSTRAIVQRYGVAMATATKVLAALQDEGFVRAVRGAGTVVTAVAAAVEAPRPAPLSLPRIRAAAIAIADAEGLEALSMRRLAADLDVAAMALYRHVESKEALTVEMTAALRSVPRPAPTAHWRASLEALADFEWRLYEAHPWMPAVVTMAAQAHTDAAVAALVGRGLDDFTCQHIALSLSSFVQGAALQRAPQPLYVFGLRALLDGCAMLLRAG